MNQNDSLFPTRITRTAYFIRGVLLLAACLADVWMMSFSEHALLATKIILVGGGVSLLLVLAVILFRSILIPRLRDVGLHPAWSLLILVHALGTVFLLALLLVPADAFAKRSYITFS